MCTLEMKTLKPRRTSVHLQFVGGPILCGNPNVIPAFPERKAWASDIRCLIEFTVNYLN